MKNDDVVRLSNLCSQVSANRMTRKEWDVSEFKDKTAQIVVIDNNSGGWGHPNFDDIHQADSKGNNILWERVLSVDARGKLAATWAQMKKYY